MNSSLISRPGIGMHVARATRTCNPSRRPALLCRGSAAAAVPAVSNGFVSTIPATAAAPAISVTVPEPKPAVLPPPLTFKAVAAVGKAKASLPSGRVFTMAVAAGIYIAFGTFFLMCVGGAMPGLAASNPGLHKLVFSLVFPVGLLMVILNAPELYTGNTAITTSAALEGEMSVKELMRNWFFSYAGNLVGSLLMVVAVAAAGSLVGNAMPVNMAVAKTSLDFGTALVRGILANTLVCIAVFQATSASSLPGKVLGIWMPITSFVVMGLEHSVANMFTIPMGMVLGAKVSLADFLLNNLLPVTLGNTLAGVMVATMAALCYGTLGAKVFGTKTA